MISHGPARYDPAELESLNARLLHEMPYDVAAPRLPRIVGAAAWDILRAESAQVLATSSPGPMCSRAKRRNRIRSRIAAFLAEALRAAAARAVG